MSEDEELKDKFFVSVRGGTQEERDSVRDRMKDYSEQKEVDVDLIDVGGEGGDVLIDIKTECGNVTVKGSDLNSGEDILENACGGIACSAISQTDGEHRPFMTTAPAKENISETVSHAEADHMEETHVTSDVDEAPPMPSDDVLVGLGHALEDGDVPVKEELKKEGPVEDDIQGTEGDGES